MSPYRNVVLLISIIWIQSTVSKECSFQKVTILNNVYSMRTLRTFEDTAPSNVFYARDIEYIVDDYNYRYNVKTNQERKLVRNTSPKSRNTVLIKADVNMTLSMLGTNKSTRVGTTINEQLLTFGYHNQLILTIKYSQSYNSLQSGKLYAFNDTDLNIVGQFVVTQWVYELGSKVIDLAINPTSGNIAVSVLDASNNGVLVLLEKKSKDFCPDYDCQEKDSHTREYVAQVLNDVGDTLFFSVEESIERAFPDLEAQLEHKDKVIDNLKIKLYVLELKLEGILEEYEKQEEFIVSGESIVKVNLNITLKTKREAKDNRKMCTSKTVYQKNLEELREAVLLVEDMQDLVDEYYLPPFPVPR